MKSHHKKHGSMNSAKKIIFGIYLVLAGLLLFAFNFDYFPQEHFHIVFSFPMLLMAFGFLNFFDRKSLYFGVIVFAVGLIAFIPKITGMHYDFWTIFWPLILIGLGLLIMLKRLFPKHKKDEEESCCFVYTKEKGEKGPGYIDEVNIFSGGDHRYTDEVFRGGSITNIFGGGEIDFTRSRLAEGKNYLDITCIFGGTTIIVPADWKISIQVNAILGAFEDKRYYIDLNNQAAADRELIITGTVVFGGGELKSR